MTLSFDVRGIPAPQGSKRHVGRGVMVESSKRVAPWREAVRTEAAAAKAERTRLWRERKAGRRPRDAIGDASRDAPSDVSSDAYGDASPSPPRPRSAASSYYSATTAATRSP